MLNYTLFFMQLLTLFKMSFTIFNLTIMIRMKHIRKNNTWRLTTTNLPPPRSASRGRLHAGVICRLHKNKMGIRAKLICGDNNANSIEYKQKG